MGKWAFSNYLQYEIHLGYDTYFLRLVIVILPGESKIKNNVPLVRTCPNSAAGRSSTVKRERLRLSPTHTIHWNWRIGHCGWWCCARLRRGTGWCCSGSRRSETPGLEAWRIHNPSWLLVMSLTPRETIRGPGWKQKERASENLQFKQAQSRRILMGHNSTTIIWVLSGLAPRYTRLTTRHTLADIFTFMCFRRELGCV